MKTMKIIKKIAARFYSGYKCRNITIGIVIMWAALFLSGCSDDSIGKYGSDSSAIPEGYVKPVLNMNVSENESVKSRATDTQEKAFDKQNVWIVVFKSSGELLQPPVKAEVVNESGKEKLYVLLRSTSENCNIYVLANLSAENITYLQGFSSSTPSTDDLENIRANLQTPVITSNVVVDNSNRMSMCSDPISCLSGTTGLNNLSPEMERIMARVDVNASAIISNFVLESVVLANAANRGQIMPGVNIPEAAGEIQYSEATELYNNQIMAQVYCFENRGTRSDGATQHPTTLIVKGKYKGNPSSYYRLDILNTSTVKPHVAYDIRRNTKYTMTISNIESVGYTSYADALSNPASNNVTYDVDVDHEYAYDIVSNGKYYLAVSNSEFVIYATNTESFATDVPINICEIETDVPYVNKDGSWVPVPFAQGTATVIGTGLTVLNNPFEGNTTPRYLNIKMDTHFTSGSVILRLGNLQKEIKVEKRTLPLDLGGTFPLGDDFVQGEIAISNDSSHYKYDKLGEFVFSTDWVRLCLEGENVSMDGPKKIINPAGGLSMHIVPNPANSGGQISRFCEMMLTPSKESGRSLVWVAQNPFDITDKGGQIENAFAGTFHRWNETGERVIKMKHSGTEVWTAAVVDDGGFIKLAAGGSSDRAIYTDNPGDAEGFQVPGNSTFIVGRGEDITFRVGMKSKLASAEAQPRYGLILVTTGAGVHRIFVRQGEAPDYLMRPIDPGANGETWGSGDTYRPLAAKWSPYNLTDPLLSAGHSVPKPSDVPEEVLQKHNQISVGDIAYNPEKFTRYPSQIGYFFQWNMLDAESVRAIHPVNNLYYITAAKTTRPVSVLLLNKVNNTNVFKPELSPCPKGYRYPSDRSLSSGLSAGEPQYSEIRQSLFYFPSSSSATDVSLNTIYGYYADGFFDRLPIVSSKLISDNGRDNTIVIKGGIENISTASGNDIGYQGRLFYNPYSYASLFFPVGGRLQVSNAKLQNAGDYGYYWTSSVSTFRMPMTMWSTSNDLHMQNSQGTANDLSSIRCVKIE